MTAGMTSGIDGAWPRCCVASGQRKPFNSTRSTRPSRPFNSGTPETAPPKLLRTIQSEMKQILEARLVIAKRVAPKLDVSTL